MDHIEERNGEMKEFKRECQCPKCLSKDTAKTYCEGSTILSSCKIGLFAACRCEPHLDVVCNQCGYAWGMKTHDYKQEAKK